MLRRPLERQAQVPSIPKTIVEFAVDLLGENQGQCRFPSEPEENLWTAISHWRRKWRAAAERIRPGTRCWLWQLRKSGRGETKMESMAMTES